MLLGAKEWTPFEEGSSNYGRNSPQNKPRFRVIKSSETTGLISATRNNHRSRNSIKNSVDSSWRFRVLERHLKSETRNFGVEASKTKKTDINNLLTESGNVIMRIMTVDNASDPSSCHRLLLEKQESSKRAN